MLIFSDIKYVEDWYNVKASDFVKHGGKGLLMLYQQNDAILLFTTVRYGNSLNNTLSQMFPNYKWDSHKFTRSYNTYWNNPLHQKACLNEIGRTSCLSHATSAKKLSIHSYEDWFKVKVEDILKHGGRSVLRKHKSLVAMLRAIYPEHKWMEWRFSKVAPGYWNSIPLSVTPLLTESTSIPNVNS